MMKKINKFLEISVIALLFRSCMGYDTQTNYMVQRYQFECAYIEDSIGNGYEFLLYTTNHVTKEQYEEILARQYIRDSYKFNPSKRNNSCKAQI